MGIRRTVGVGIALLTLVVVACQPPQPPSNYVPPVLDSVSVSPAAATPGSTITITVRAHDDEGIRAVQNDGFALRENQQLPWEFTSCSNFLVAPDGPGAVVATATCVIPTFASNGTWTAMFTLLDTSSYWGTHGRAAFEVVGGSDDATGPATESVQYQPGPTMTSTGTFTATARVTDPTGPISAPKSCCPPALFGGTSTLINCTEATVVPVSSTSADVTVVCGGGAAVVPGEYQGRVVVSDALGNRSDVALAVTVT